MRILEPEAFGQLRFVEAAPMWLEQHRDAIEPKTILDYQYYIRSLNRFFGELPLRDIHIGHVNSYREQRALSAGPGCINKEINTLKQIMERAGLWRHDIARFYRPLKMGKCTVGQALEPEAEERLIAAAASNRRWRVAYWCSLLTATTTAGPKEITHLHLGDVDLVNKRLLIRDGLKNEHRDRLPELNETAVWALEQILRRYQKICRRGRVAPDAEHFILPGRKRGGVYDVNKPMCSWKKAWRALREKAELPTLRMYDLRHHAITKLLEDPDISERTIEEMAGHVPGNMKKRYSHIRRQKLREAAGTLELKRPVTGFQIVPRKDASA